MWLVMSVYVIIVADSLNINSPFSLAALTTSISESYICDIIIVKLIQNTKRTQQDSI